MAQRPVTNKPDVTYPAELPISERREDLLKAIAANQVLIVAGETGSGKSTQLPKMCLELGYGGEGRYIGHTQPRRLAARTIAERIANELDSELGKVVGYKVRFDDRVQSTAQIKLMTDGVLLAETQRDRLLKKYDVIIIDEAHERSLNIDFILGYLKQILPKRPDLKIIVTSATIDTGRFSKHFDDAPIIEVSGRTYPVEIRYQPLESEQISQPTSKSQTVDQATGIAEAVQNLWIETEGDILVFCSGEQEIRDATEAVSDLDLPNTEILPLYARLPAAQQQRVFKPQQRRRVVVSTNVAETSVTVPGIRTVVDAGTARISRYSQRTKVQRLPIEPISQASANQRSGRCGRLGPGICIRLYSEEDFASRDEFTEPEIQRTNLAAVILQMMSLKLGPIADFGFVDPPDNRAISDGIALLEELDALETSDDKKALTPTGRTLAKLPIEPRLGRMLIEADRNASLNEVLIIVAALAVADPRERPRDAEQAAREAHSKHADPASDFVTFLNLWKYLERERKSKSGNQFRKQCRREFLNFLRVREWQATHKQLQRLCKRLKLSGSSSPASHDTIHQALLTGLLSQVGYLEVETESDKRNTSKHGGGRNRRTKPATYIGARNVKFSINPGSSLAKARRQWVMVGELVETSQVWARVVAAVDPEWICDAGAHITKHSFAEPWWDADAGAAMSKERITLFGLTVVANRRTQLSRWSVSEAREMFIHHALVLNDWQKSAYPFVAANDEVFDAVDELEAKQRKNDAEDRHEKLFRFFDERLPDDVANVGDFNGWWKKQSQSSPSTLRISADLLLDQDPSDDEKLFPTSWHVCDLDLELAYAFDPQSHIDGVSVHVPLSSLGGLDAAPFEWSVPGFRNELIEQLLRSLPKSLRKQLLPISEAVGWAQQSLGNTHSQSLGMFELLAERISSRAGVAIEASDFNLERVSAHLRPTFRVINERSEVVAEGKDLRALEAQLVEHTKRSLEQRLTQKPNSSLERQGITSWDFESLPESAVVSVAGQQVECYPALFDEGSTVAIRLFATKDEQFEAMWDGVRRLLRLRLGSPLRRLDALVSNEAKLWLAAPPVQSKASWYNDAINCVLDHQITAHQPLPRTRSDFERLTTETESSFESLLGEVAQNLSWFVLELTSLNRRLEERGNRNTSDVVIADLTNHRDRLFYPGFLSGLGFERLGDARRFAAAMNRRLQDLPTNEGRDRDAMRLCQQVEVELAKAIDNYGKTTDLEALLWQVEELRASVFSVRSQQVSAKKIRRRLADLDLANR